MIFQVRVVNHSRICPRATTLRSYGAAEGREPFSERENATLFPLDPDINERGFEGKYAGGLASQARL